MFSAYFFLCFLRLYYTSLHLVYSVSFHPFILLGIGYVYAVRYSTILYKLWHKAKQKKNKKKKIRIPMRSRVAKER